MPILKSKQEYIRRKVLTCLWRRGPMTRSNIAALTHLSLPSVTNLLQQLRTEGLLHSARNSTPPSRREILVHPGSDKLKAVALHITRRQVSSAIVSADGRVDNEEHTPLPAANNGAQLLETISNAVRAALRRTKPSGVRGVGIAMAGSVRQRSISENFPTISAWSDVNVAEKISAQHRLPCYVDNDTLAETLAEAHYGLAKGSINAVFLHYGWGLQLGMILNSELYRGRDHCGEFGHMRVNRHGPICSCGNSGCLEAACSIGAVIRTITHSIDQGAVSKVLELANGDLRLITWEHIVQSAEGGDVLAFNVLRNAIELLANGLGSVIHLLDPELVILGGKIASLPSCLIEDFRTRILLQLQIPVRHQLRIAVSDLGPRGGLIGAAALVFESIFSETRP